MKKFICDSCKKEVSDSDSHRTHCGVQLEAVNDASLKEIQGDVKKLVVALKALYATMKEAGQQGAYTAAIESALKQSGTSKNPSVIV